MAGDKAEAEETNYYLITLQSCRDTLIPNARDAVSEAATRAFIDGINDLFIIAALVAFTGAVAALILVRSSDLVAQGPPQPAQPAAAEQSAV